VISRCVATAATACISSMSCTRRCFDRSARVIPRLTSSTRTCVNAMALCTRPVHRRPRLVDEHLPIGTRPGHRRSGSPTSLSNPGSGRNATTRRVTRPLHLARARPADGRPARRDVRAGPGATFVVKLRAPSRGAARPVAYPPGPNSSRDTASRSTSPCWIVARW
jgi:hypothetical protein